jgi:hypothetical protein
MAFEGATAGAIIGLRILVAARSSLRAALVGATAIVSFATIAAVVGDLAAIGWSLVAAGVVGTTAWWLQLRSASGTVTAVPAPRASGTVTPETSAGD